MWSAPATGSRTLAENNSPKPTRARAGLPAAVVITLLCSTSARAATTAEPVVAASGAGNMLADYFRMLWGLLIVLGIILLCYALLKKRFSLVGSQGSAIKVVEMRPLAPKKSICLVNVKGKEYLLGIGTDSITLLASLDPPPRPTFQEALDSSQASRRT